MRLRRLSTASGVVAAALLLSIAIHGPSFAGDYIRALSNTGAPNEYMPNFGDFVVTAGLGIRAYLAIAAAAALTILAIALRRPQLAYGHAYDYDYALHTRFTAAGCAASMV